MTAFDSLSILIRTVVGCSIIDLIGLYMMFLSRPAIFAYGQLIKAELGPLSGHYLVTG